MKFVFVFSLFVASVSSLCVMKGVAVCDDLCDLAFSSRYVDEVDFEGLTADFRCIIATANQHIQVRIFPYCKHQISKNSHTIKETYIHICCFSQKITLHRKTLCIHLEHFKGEVIDAKYCVVPVMNDGKVNI